MAGEEAEPCRPHTLSRAIFKLGDDPRADVDGFEPFVDRDPQRAAGAEQGGGARAIGKPQPGTSLGAANRVTDSPSRWLYARTRIWGQGASEHQVGSCSREQLGKVPWTHPRERGRAVEDRLDQPVGVALGRTSLMPMRIWMEAPTRPLTVDELPAERRFHQYR